MPTGKGSQIPDLCDMRDVATIDFINFPGTLKSEIGLCQFHRLFLQSAELSAAFHV